MPDERIRDESEMPEKMTDAGERAASPADLNPLTSADLTLPATSLASAGR